MQRKDRTGNIPGTRLCTKCKQSLPVESFHVDNNRFDGLTTWCAECRNEAVRQYTDPEVARERLRRWRKANPEKKQEQDRRNRQKRRRELIDRYGGKCACCGETAIEFLAIDHTNGGGEKHRREVGQGDVFYKWLKANGFPDGFRVLCHNCNQSIGFYGYCPHQKLVE